ncbi:hypothetical protein Bca52824_007542 [Brassica carinata]|uniref:MATH domain-containing protein n=1 Tax=Brassica carinata TaxID=52824 RepID=A0A8X7W836_BRACI|nr:hypothetical protein Bca52824_007542 [Brassica carinata]
MKQSIRCRSTGNKVTCRGMEQSNGLKEINALGEVVGNCYRKGVATGGEESNGAPAQASLADPPTSSGAEPELRQWFEQKSPNWGRASMLPLNELNAKDSGFLVNGDLKILVEIDVLEVVGRLDVTEETSTIIERMDVNGFQILPSHAESVSRMFERHSELASEFRPKNPNLRTAYINFLLSLIETMCQSPQDLSQDDLSDAYAAMGFMRDAGFKLDWLEKKLDEVSEKKKNVKSSEAGLQEMEEDLRDLKRKYSAMEALVQKEKVKISAAKAPLSFDDVV